VWALGTWMLGTGAGLGTAISASFSSSSNSSESSGASLSAFVVAGGLVEITGGFAADAGRWRGNGFFADEVGCALEAGTGCVSFERFVGPAPARPDEIAPPGAEATARGLGAA
jgi:hypothetical protein